MSIFSDILNDVGAEVSRQTSQGAAELAAAIFGGSGFVQYGVGQDISKHQVEAPAPEQTVEEQGRGLEM